MSKSILSMTDIRKTFSGVAVLDEVKLDLNEGECLGLLGSNGAKIYINKNFIRNLF